MKRCAMAIVKTKSVKYSETTRWHTAVICMCYMALHWNIVIKHLNLWILKTDLTWKHWSQLEISSSPYTSNTLLKASNLYMLNVDRSLKHRHHNKVNILTLPFALCIPSYNPTETVNPMAHLRISVWWNRPKRRVHGIEIPTTLRVWNLWWRHRPSPIRYAPSIRRIQECLSIANRDHSSSRRMDNKNTCDLKKY